MNYIVSYKKDENSVEIIEGVEYSTFDIFVISPEGIKARGFVHSEESAKKIVNSISNSDEKAKKYFDTWINY